MKNMIKTFTTILFFHLVNFSTLLAQEEIDWSYLADVKFEVKFSYKLGYDLHHADFGKLIQQFKL